MRLSRLIVCLLAVLLLVPVAGFAQAPQAAFVKTQPVPDWVLEMRPQQKPIRVLKFNDLYSRLQSGETVRIIGRFAEPENVPTVSPGGEKRQQALEHRWDALRKVRDRLRDKLPEQAKASFRDFVGFIPFFAMKVDQDSFQSLLRDPDVVFIEEAIPLPPALDVSVPLIGADSSGNFSGYSGIGQTIAILDTGVEANHPYLQGKVVEEACFAEECPNGQNSQIGVGAAAPCETNPNVCSHGTHVAGIAASVDGTYSGVARGSDIIAIQVFSEVYDTATCSGFGYSTPCTLWYVDDLLAALTHVYDLRNTYDIAAVNMSLGGGHYTDNCDEALGEGGNQAFIDLKTAGIPTIVASGNRAYDEDTGVYANGVGFPACLSSTVSVGNTTDSDTINDTSQAFQYLDLLAPGTGIISSVPFGDLAYPQQSKTGTSMSAPHVAGAWAVIKSKVPNATIDEVLTALKSTGQLITDTRWTPNVTAARIDVEAAIDSLTFASVSAGFNHTLAIRADGSLWAWGGNVVSQLGDGSTTESHVPIMIGTDRDWFEVAAGSSRSLALKSDGSLWGWGYNGYGSVGDGTTVGKSVPVRIGADSDWVKIAANHFQSFALKADGTLWAWGKNAEGQLGTGDYVKRLAPVQIGNDSDWIDIAPGFYHTLALKADRTLWAWGRNNYGQLGNGSIIDSTQPVLVSGGAGWTSISADQSSCTAVRADGTLWSWGSNAQGQIGDGTINSSTVPVPIIDDDWQVAAKGSVHTVAIKGDGSLWAWGSNYYGEVGDGTTSNRHSPVLVDDQSVWTHIVGGGQDTFARRADGTLWSWGYNAYGNLGIGTTVNMSTPQMVTW